MNDEQRRVWEGLTGEQRTRYAWSFLSPEERARFERERREYRRYVIGSTLRAAGLLILAVAALAALAYGLPLALPGLQW